MPRYFFDIDNHVRDIDEDGVELAGPDIARIQAVMFAADYLRDDPAPICNGQTLGIAVSDETGTVLLRIEISATDPVAATQRNIC